MHVRFIGCAFTLAGCQGGHHMVDGGADARTAVVTTAGETLSTPSIGPLELAWDGHAAFATWVSPDHVAGGVVVEAHGHHLGATAELSTVPNAVEAHALLLGNAQLAVGIVTDDGSLAVAIADDRGFVGTPIALSLPYAGCRFAPPDKLVCPADATRAVLGIIAPNGADVTFGPASPLSTIAHAPRSTRSLLAFFDRNDCLLAAPITFDNELSQTHVISCQATPIALTDAFLALAETPGVSEHAYLVRSTDTTHRDCAFIEFRDPDLSTLGTTATDDNCPQVAAYGRFDVLFDLTFDASAGTAMAAAHQLDGSVFRLPSPILGLPNLTTGAIVATEVSGLAVTTDGERLQFTAVDI